MNLHKAKKENHYFFSSQVRADQMPGPPREGQLPSEVFLCQLAVTWITCQELHRVGREFDAPLPAKELEQVRSCAITTPHSRSSKRAVLFDVGRGSVSASASLQDPSRSRYLRVERRQHTVTVIFFTCAQCHERLDFHFLRSLADIL